MDQATLPGGRQNQRKNPNDLFHFGGRQGQVHVSIRCGVALLSESHFSCFLPTEFGGKIGIMHRPVAVKSVKDVANVHGIHVPFQRMRMRSLLTEFI